MLRNKLKIIQNNYIFTNRLRLISRLMQQSTTKCWNCGGTNSSSTLFCENCSKIQAPPKDNNFFKVFNLKNRFDIDLNMLNEKYKKLQIQLHPDKFTNRTEEEKKISEEYSALVNSAYKKLQVPLQRAIHLLELEDIAINEDDKVTDPTFLMHVMELNEEVENIKTNEDLVNLNNKNKRVIDSLIKELSTYFKEQNHSSAKNGVIKMKYYNSLSGRINHLLREKGIVD